ncbi:glucosidase 2 subunit beta-like [Engraulis encrasicolus]|uniref:glucosidase 2 subunit beta-like n=1 Tax=Engraulis encrasicolus TaxID=184585 RepID=UPI002FD54709
MHCQIAIAVTIWAAVFVEARKIRGISMSYKRFYKERKSFVCIDGSRLIPFEQVNDDYCDCADGSDEPGTAACSNGRFYCTNLGFRPEYIPSSRVNDGICDCCDGSEEYNSPVQCQDTCRNLGQRERLEMEERRRMLSEGADVWRDKQAELANLRGVANSMLAQLELQRHRKSQAEAHRHEVLMAARGFRTPSPLDSRGPGPGETERVAEEGEDGKTEQEPAAAHIEYSPTQDERGEDPVEEDPDVKAAVQAAEAAGSDLRKAEMEYQQLQYDIRELEDRLAIDFGRQREFLFLLGRCFESTANEYSYTLCPFHQVTQKSRAGTEVLLGTWDSWVGTPENPFNFDVGLLGGHS